MGRSPRTFDEFDWASFCSSLLPRAILPAPRKLRQEDAISMLGNCCFARCSGLPLPPVKSLCLSLESPARGESASGSVLLSVLDYFYFNFLTRDIDFVVSWVVFA